MIMALIYRNVGAQEDQRAAAARRADLRRGGRADRDRQPGRRRRGVRRRACSEWAEKLAAKSPVMMRLGKDAMFRQQDMAFADALDFLRSQLTIAFSTEDIQEGVTAFFEKREPRVEGALMAAQAPASSLLRPLAEDLRARREQIKLGGGAEKIDRQHAREKLTARERIALLIDEGTFVELGIHGRPHFSQRAMEGRDAPADGVITGYGKVDGRLAAVAAYDFTVMAGSMGMTGELKVTRLRELALTKRIPMIWLLDSAGARIQEAVGSLFAGTRPPVPRGGRSMSGVIPQVAALMGPCAAGHRLHPRAGRLRADGQGARLDGAGRAAPGAGRGRRGRHPGGARRLARALPQVGRGRPRGRRRPGVHRADQAVPELLPAATARRRRRSRPTQRPDRPRRRGAARRPARSPTASRTTCTR